MLQAERQSAAASVQTHRLRARRALEGRFISKRNDVIRVIVAFGSPVQEIEGYVGLFPNLPKGGKP